MNMKKLWPVLVLLGLGCLGTLAVGAYYMLVVRGTPQPVPPATTPILVRILNPPSGSHYPENGFVPLQIEAHSQRPIAALQLWSNGALVAVKPPPDGLLPTDFITFWNWPMGGAGEQVLLVRAVDADGRASTSNGVRVGSSPSVGGVGVFTSQGGDTLAGVADAFGVDPQAINDQNPGLDPESPIPQGTNVQIPITLPAINPQPEPPLPLPEIHANDAPLAPALSGDAQGCTASLQIADHSDNEKGFAVYRLSSNSSDFVRLTTLGPNSATKPLNFSVNNLTGDAEFYVSAFNNDGESPSNILHLTVAATCSGENAGGMILEDGMLSLSQPVELAYLYASLNGSVFQRIPQAPDDFFPVNTGKVDLNPYLKDLIPADAKYPLLLDLQAWGWSGSVLVELGTLHTQLESSGLDVCRLSGGNCDGDVGKQNLSTEDSVAADSPNQVRTFYWKSSLPSVDTAVMQIALAPFSAEFQAHPQKLVNSKVVSGMGNATSSHGTFAVDFSLLGTSLVDSSSPPTSEPTASPEGGGLWFNYLFTYVPGMSYEPQPYDFYPITYYLRIVPVVNGQPSGPPSNTVVIKYGPQGPPTVGAIFPPSIYTAEVIEFTPLKAPTLDWGCVIIESVDPDAPAFESLPWKLYLPSYQLLQQTGTPFCPEKFKGGSPPWYESFWDFLSGAVSWVKDTWDAIKNTVVETIAARLNDLVPGICPDKCQTGLTIALNAGLAALGIPPDLPDLSQLTQEGIDGLVDAGASMVGVKCDDLCKGIIHKAIDTMVEDNLYSQAASYMDTEEAHRHGMEPLVLAPSGLHIIPAPQSKLQPPYLKVRVTRSPDSGNIDPAQLRYYHLVIRNWTTNTWIVGRDVDWPASYCADDYSWWPCGLVWMTVTEPLTGMLFEPVDLPIIGLEPGESKEYLLTLMPTDWYLPAHTENRFVGYDDWKWLYRNGTTEFKVTIECPTIFSNACGEGDDYTTDMMPAP
jgi:LysM repeat protein